VTPDELRRVAWVREHAVEQEGAAGEAAPEPRSNVRDSGQVEGVRGNREVPPTELDQKLADVTRERDEYLAALQRLKAEFDNYRKRVAREEQQLVARAGERVVKQLLPMADDLERAVEAAVEHGETKVADGVRLVHRALVDLLGREGLVEVETAGPFDPHTQEALLTQPSDEPEGTVIQVLQKGFKLGDHVLRAARVVVSSGPPDPPEPGDGE
jgi:molecular chaperone GrpE